RPGELARSGRRRVRARGTVHPARLAVAVVLFLPDRHALLGLVDDVAARVERGAAVRRRDSDPDRAVADRELADAVLATRRRHREALERLADDLRALLLGDSGMRLVLERDDGRAVVVIADPAFERDAGPGGIGLERALELHGIDRTRRDLKAH